MIFPKQVAPSAAPSVEQSGNASAANCSVAVSGIVYGPITVGSHRRYLVEPYQLAAVPLEQVDLSPSRLLAASHEVVPFTGRTDELTDLSAWLDGPGRSARLLHGAGGQGKSRLAGQFAALTAAAGWEVVNVRHDSTLSPLTVTATESGKDIGRGVLVVIDYAERWSTTDLLDVIRDRLLGHPGRTRLLLLARPAGLWWQNLCHHLNNGGISTSETALTPLAQTATARRELFNTAVEAFAPYLGLTDTSGVAEPAMENDDWRLVLTVHMAALAAVHAYQHGQVAPENPAELSTYLINKEASYWHSLLESSRVRTRPETMRRAVCAAILTRALPYEQALDAVTRAGLAGHDDADQVLDDHRLCYPPTSPRTALEPLQPDRLAEDFIALAAPGSAGTGASGEPTPPSGTADMWTTGAISRLLKPINDELWPYTAVAVTMLIEATHRWPHVGREVLYPLLIAHPTLGIAAGEAALIRLTDIPGLDMAVLEAIERTLPSGSVVDLDAAFAAITAKLARHHVDGGADEAEQARLYMNLGYRMQNAGRLEEAARASSEAAEIYRQLVARDPATFRPLLAQALNEQSTSLGQLHLSEQSLRANSESLDIYRRLAADDPDTYEDGLARTLNNRSHILTDLDRYREAEAASAKAVKIRRRMAAKNPRAFTSSLAASLTNYSICLSRLGKRAAALSSGAEAVRLGQGLMKGNGSPFLPDLAIAIRNFGMRLFEAGRSEDALDASACAVELHRALEKVNQAAFEEDLARSLDCFVLVRLDRGVELEEALLAARESVEIWERLALRAPVELTGHLRHGLLRQLLLLERLGRLEQDGPTVMQRLAESQPPAGGAPGGLFGDGGPGMALGPASQRQRPPRQNRPQDRATPKSKKKRRRGR
ncbi:tetratricopeptide repeat protein [Micromonospora carbonacea]|uniref:tetratricopeptide repeat protein n=1 Tax=Micromonospora carbonacea TaxID=47853 RepID=UPI0037143B49